MKRCGGLLVISLCLVWPGLVLAHDAHDGSWEQENETAMLAPGNITSQSPTTASPVSSTSSSMPFVSVTQQTTSGSHQIRLQDNTLGVFGLPSLITLSSILLILFVIFIFLVVKRRSRHRLYVISGERNRKMKCLKGILDPSRFRRMLKRDEAEKIVSVSYTPSVGPFAWPHHQILAASEKLNGKPRRLVMSQYLIPKGDNVVSLSWTPKATSLTSLNKPLAERTSIKRAVAHRLPSLPARRELSEEAFENKIPPWCQLKQFPSHGSDLYVKDAYRSDLPQKNNPCTPRFENELTELTLQPSGGAVDGMLGVTRCPSIYSTYGCRPVTGSNDRHEQWDPVSRRSSQHSISDFTQQRLSYRRNSLECGSTDLESARLALSRKRSQSLNAHDRACLRMKLRRIGVDNSAPFRLTRTGSNPSTPTCNACSAPDSCLHILPSLNAHRLLERQRKPASGPRTPQTSPRLAASTSSELLRGSEVHLFSQEYDLDVRPALSPIYACLEASPCPDEEQLELENEFDSTYLMPETHLRAGAKRVSSLYESLPNLDCTQFEGNTFTASEAGFERENPIYMSIKRLNSSTLQSSNQPQYLKRQPSVENFLGALSKLDSEPTPF